MSFFRNFGKIWNRTNSEYSANSECSETLVFDPKFFHKIFPNSEKTGFSEKFPNFGNQTIPKLAKMKNSEISVFRRSLLFLLLNKAS